MLLNMHSSAVPSFTDGVSRRNTGGILRVMLRQAAKAKHTQLHMMQWRESGVPQKAEVL